MPLAKKLGVLAVAIAVPTLAAPGTIAALQPGPESADVAPMPFETAGESFPGSAFYYLEDTPQLIEAEGWDRPIQVIGGSQFAAAATADGIADLPLAARPLRIVGSDRDHMRAQQCMAQAIYYEAASESDAGQRAVAQVVLNRVAHPAYPNTVCGVVYQGSERRTGCQFTFTCDGALARTPSQSGWSRASRIARESLAGVVYAPVGTATHYHTLAVNPYWASSLDTVGVIGAHIFYRWKGAAGQPAAFRSGYAGAEPAPARSRAATPEAPDPVEAPVMADYAAPAPAPSSYAIPTAAPAQVAEERSDILPQSGDVRSEYANSGRWLTRP
ncbi:MAG: cell wall hydrolase [Erythrobacter sp.]|nr:MAG: cell wall hydrolase [Erythrobacter sp.]